MSFDDIIVMCHCDLSRAVEEHRKGRPMIYYPCNDGDVCEKDKPEGRRRVCASPWYTREGDCPVKRREPHGVAVALADCVLRILDVLVHMMGFAFCVGIILDWAEQEGVDMEAILREKHEYNKAQLKG